MNGLELSEMVDGAFTDVSLSQDLNLQNNAIVALHANAFDNLDARDLYVVKLNRYQFYSVAPVYTKDKIPWV